ncbi:MAG: maltose O-acetyltransferase, partial [Akkermansiaceae bacterium]|nr:maltose O-acetyltransferase [Akkermansiaceae bacterium]
MRPEAVYRGGMELRSEKEKMLAGELYQATDPELTAGRLRARRLCRAYNASTEEEP